MAQSHNRSGFWPISPSPLIMKFPEAASSSFKKGTPVFLHTDGKLTVAAAATSVGFCGVAAEDATGTTGNMCAVWADPNEVFIGIMDADSSSVVAGYLADLIVTSSQFYIDTDASAVDHFSVIAPVDTTQDALATARARWYVRINGHQLAA